MTNNDKAAPRWQAQGGKRRKSAGSDLVRHSHHSMAVERRQAPLGEIPPRIDASGLITIGGRKVASVRGNALRRTFGGHEWYHDGLAFRTDVLHLACEHGALRIIVTERTTKRRWVIEMSDFMRHGWSFAHKMYGEQHACKMQYWTPQAQAGPGHEAKPVARQLALFGGGR